MENRNLAQSCAESGPIGGTSHRDVLRSAKPWWVLTRSLVAGGRMVRRMMTESLRGVPVPAHVPAEAVVDFDFQNPQGAHDDVILAWHRLAGRRPMLWTPRNGGHWIATNAAAIEELQMDSQRFSHREMILPAGLKPFKMLPLEADPPEHLQYRKIIHPWFTPSKVRALEGKARELACELIDQIVARGECEFVSEFAQLYPIGMFLGLVDFPASDRAALLAYTEGAVRGTPIKRLQSIVQMHFYLGEKVVDRDRNPGDDLISRMCKAEIKGRKLSEEELHGMMAVVVFGGLDTVAAMASFITCFLAQNPAHRQQLIDHPELIPHAVDEMIRRHGVTNTSRYVTEDTEVCGQRLKQGDMVQVPNVLFGLDPERFADPLTVDFTRKGPIRHAAFGNGAHRCVGSLLAEMELRVFLEEWLKRIPDFHITAGQAPRFSSGMVNGVTRLPLTIAKACVR
jgi:cytochrome P450